jgi:hypothetical protein
MFGVGRRRDGGLWERGGGCIVVVSYTWVARAQCERGEEGKYRSALPGLEAIEREREGRRRGEGESERTKETRLGLVWEIWGRIGDSPERKERWYKRLAKGYRTALGEGPKKLKTTYEQRSYFSLKK